jgi:hypothetical protein
MVSCVSSQLLSVAALVKVVFLEWRMWNARRPRLCLTVLRLLMFMSALVALGACGRSPGEAFFALERELVDKVEPYAGEPDKARAALCEWFEAEGARIRETSAAYKAFLEELEAKPDPAMSASLKAMQEAQSSRFDRVYSPLLADERFFAVSIWFDSPEGTDLKKACAEGPGDPAAPSPPKAMPNVLTSTDYAIVFPAKPSSDDLDALRKHHEARLGEATFILTEIIVEPTQSALLVPSPLGMFLADAKRFAKDGGTIVRQGVVVVGGQPGYEVVYEEKADNRLRHMRFAVAVDRLYRVTTIVPLSRAADYRAITDEFAASFTLLRDEPAYGTTLSTYTSGELTLEVAEPPENQVIVIPDHHTSLEVTVGWLPWPAHTCIVWQPSAEQLAKIDEGGLAAEIDRIAKAYLEGPRRQSDKIRLGDAELERWTVSGVLRPAFGGGEARLLAALTPNRLLLLGLSYPGGESWVERCWRSVKRTE